MATKTLQELNKNKVTNMTKKYSVQEIQQFMNKQQMLNEKFAKTKDAVQLVDLTKTETRSYSTFSKDTLRNYMKNPKANEDNLRALSQFLYRLSFPYRRIISYYSSMVDLSAYAIIPSYDYEKEDVDAMLKQYHETANQVEKMNMPAQIMQMLTVAWREDCFYGYIYEDEKGFFIMPLDGKYCKVSSMDFNGNLNFAFDFSYFRSNNAYLDYWDNEFAKKYKKYQTDNSLRWQELDPSKTVCIKVNIDDKTLVMPPLASIFEMLIDLIDLMSVQALNDELSTYKLLVAKLNTLSGTNTPDDFEVDLDTAIEFYNRLADSLPDGVSSAMSVLDIEPITFKDDQTENVNKISSSMSNLFANVGVSQILDTTKISGSTAFNASVMADTLMSIRVLLPQIENFVNKYLRVSLTNPAKVKYMEITPYTKGEKITQLKDAATLGVPVKIPLATLQGFSPSDIASMQKIEEGLGVFTDWKPLESSYNASSKKAGAPTKDVDAGDDLTDKGEESRDYR